MITTETSTTGTTTTSSTKFATLFCFEVLRTDGFEVELLREQEKRGASVFGCEECSLFSNGGVVQVGPRTSREIKTPAATIGDMAKNGVTTNSWLNTVIFMEAWDMVIAEGTWWNHAWTIKADPDAVFFPQRLKARLHPFYPAGTADSEGPALFVANCDRTWSPSEPVTLKLFGSLEIYSRNAIGTYKAFEKKCKSELDWEGWGEDFFMQSCLKLLDVGVVNGVDFIGDKRCHAAPCSDSSKVAFHPFKSKEEYFGCWDESLAAQAKEEEHGQVLHFLQ
jgi:hypothetical protein